jgi:uncharacterized membrane protein YedE/YeeE
MIKKIGLPLIALTAVLAFAAPKQADARVRFGVSIGAPVYVGPAPYVPYAYPGYNPYYAAPYPAYVAPGPVYGGPSVGIGLGFGGGYGYGYSRPAIVNRGYNGFRGRSGYRGRR